MTNPQTRQSGPRRNAKSNSAVWKSGLLALSLVTVVGGTTMIGKVDAAQQAIAQQPAAQQIVVVRQPSGALVTRQTAPANSFSQLPRTTIPAAPQQRVFRRPITRTRGS